jgi:hypothetical protein
MAATIADHVEPHKVISKNSSSASFSRFVKLHHESAKKREEARGYSTQIGADSTPGITYIRGAGGHEIFLKLAPNANAAAPRFCYNFIA